MIRTKPLVGAAHINWSHPLARGLRGCWLLNEGAGLRARNLASGKDAALSAAGVWGFGLGVRALICSGTSYVDCGTVDADVLSPITVAAGTGGIAPFTVTDPHHVVSIGYNGSSTQWYLSTNTWTSTWNMRFGAYNGSVHEAITAGHIEGAAYYNFAGSHDGATYRVYVNGRLDGSTVDAQGPVNSNQRLIIGGVDLLGAVSQPWEGPIYYVYVWNRALTAGDIAALHVDPYAFLARLRRQRGQRVTAAVEPGTVAPHYYQRRRALLAGAH